MKNLAAYYRPQTFAQVTGQSLVTTVLSRAAAEDKVAPAYLLSGTRGVGKTTIARILAKALNCQNAPTAEPCNQCEQCRKITQGNHVDVTEIDGASNNSVEDARALREHIGYAPMEGRYKVFIIDEAHMLSRSAFNALLKTLEEPPPRVVFIFATTEVHKFPITIVSRCQHFIFKRLPEETLISHLTNVLEREEVPFEPQAVQLLARRAAGSVRDGMSLLGQTLALGGQKLTVDATRNVLGLAGQDIFFGLFTAMHTADYVQITKLLHSVLDQGADIGFFLRELAHMWRTAFLLRQGGKAILPVLGIAEDDLPHWRDVVRAFSLPHIHAAWHMVLDAQRKVIQSPDPAAALELLLFNLALIPQLLPLEKVQTLAGVTESSAEDVTLPPIPPETTHADSAGTQPKIAPPSPAPASSVPFMAESTPVVASALPVDTLSVNDDTPATSLPASDATATASALSAADEKEKTSAPAVATSHAGATNMAGNTLLDDTQTANTEQPAARQPSVTLTWEGLLEHKVLVGEGLLSARQLQQVRGRVAQTSLFLATDIKGVYQKLEQILPAIAKAVSEYAGCTIQVQMDHTAPTCPTQVELVTTFNDHAELQHCKDILHAKVITVQPKNK